ncbi:histidine phosphatase family protein [Paracoccus limosus]|jgi:broad specificity phosphatase PhoE|nr:histidine phosphatase family protein [Paracoccus limosus]
MAVRLLLIAAVAPAGAQFPADPPAAPGPLSRVRPLERPGQAVSSPLLRARQTAAALGLQPVIEPALAEVDFGAWRGQSPEAVLQGDPAGFARWHADPAQAPHGGESFAAMSARVIDWLARIAGQAGTLVAVSHPGPMQAALLHVLGAGTAEAGRIGVGSLSRLQLSHDGRRWSVVLPAGA